MTGLNDTQLKKIEKTQIPSADPLLPQRNLSSATKYFSIANASTPTGNLSENSNIIWIWKSRLRLFKLKISSFTLFIRKADEEKALFSIHGYLTDDDSWLI